MVDITVYENSMDLFANTDQAKTQMVANQTATSIISTTMPIYRLPCMEDLANIAEIYNYAVRETAATFDTEEKSSDYFRSFVPGDNLHRMLVAEVNGQAVAYGGVYPFSQRKAYSQFAEMMLYVHPSWQRHGIGSGLLRAIHANNFLGGLYTVIVLINKDNRHVHRAFEQLGYTYKGEMSDVAFKLGKRQSLVMYQRHCIG